MPQLPDGLPTYVGQATPTDADRERIRRLMAAVDEIEKPTSYNNPDLPSHQDGVRIGDALPVDQPGRPSMSPRATDASVMMIAGGFLSLCLGAAISGVLYFSGTANENVVIAVCAAPPVTFIALKGLMKGVKQAVLPDQHHHTYNGPVDQRTIQSKSVGVWARTTNKP